MKGFAGEVSVFIGSGITTETVSKYTQYADGFIVGTAFKRDGNPANPIETDRVKTLRAVLS